MNPIEAFQAEVARNIEALGNDAEALHLSRQWSALTNRNGYTYNFSWLGRPIIQYPQDMVALQEIIWKVKPDLIIETGIAHGGSLILSASMLSMLDYCDAVESGTMLDPQKSRRRVLGVDIDIRPHNREAIEKHPMAHRIDMIQGSSIDPEIVAQVKKAAAGYERVLVILDSNHTHAHVLEELRAYAPLTSVDSYCIVFDTLVEDLPDEMFANRPWGKGDNPKTAVWEYLRDLNASPSVGFDGKPLGFEIDKSIENKLLITVAPDGFLKRLA
ncbi:cephalosporin hydroxylase family protein [Cupriavidus necator]|uniref:cephalosporin hydroxylase family protein n=1 Tax=Cupriavidus necator TaxID=106590 RepID=UPI003ECDDAC3